MSVHQFSFDFTCSHVPRAHVPPRPGWQVTTLRRRFRLPPAQAAFYAEQMGFPVRGVRS